MPTFPLSENLALLHSNVIAYASAIQNTIAQHGGCQTISSEALNVLAFNAILAHRGVRTLCEEGWTPLTPIMNRTMLDIFANCIAVLTQPESADYMGFKYFSDFYRKWLATPEITEPERAEATTAIELLIGKLGRPDDQERARALTQERQPRTHWFQPEYRTITDVLGHARHDINQLYRFFSPVTHGGFSAKVIFNDDPALEDIEPRAHPRNTARAIAACSRLLLEVCYVRDQWDNAGVGEATYYEILTQLNALR